MNFKEPRPKKYNKLLVSQPLPLITLENGNIYHFTGHFDGFCVRVSLKDDMKKLNSMGCFGKANFSRGYPTFSSSEDQVSLLRKRVFNQRKEWNQKFPTDNKTKPLKKVLVVPDSEEESEDYFTNVLVEYQFDSVPIQESLHLGLEEALFLAVGIKCLKIYDSSELLPEHKLWELFCNTDCYFVQNYIVYHYFRAKGWVVKPGIKFGGDFLLYKDGPPFYHASYLVIIDILDSETLQRRNDLCRRAMATVNICGLNRLCETVGKELLICQLIWPSNLKKCQYEDISSISVNQVILNRWISSQNRELEDS